MKEKILQMVDAYWKFDEAQQPMSSWHDKQDLLKALEELLQPTVIKSLPEYNEIIYHAKILSEEQFRQYWDEVQGNVL